jgi:hypothetical protein
MVSPKRDSFENGWRRGHEAQAGQGSDNSLQLRSRRND